MDEMEMNMTLLEEDVFRHITNDTIEERVNWNPSIIFAIAGTLELLIICIAIIVDLFLITVLIRFQRLKTRINAYILHILILNVMCHIFSHVVMFVTNTFGIYCLVTELETICLSASFLLATALAVDWYLTTFVSGFMEKTKKLYNYFFILLYIVIILTLGIYYENCLDMIISRSLFVFCLLVLSVINILTCIKNVSYETNKTVYAVTIANLSVYTWLGVFFIDILYEFNFVYLSNFWINLLTITGLIANTIAYGSPVLMLFILGKRNKYFKMAYDRTFKKSTRLYEDDELDVASDVQHNA